MWVCTLFMKEFIKETLSENGVPSCKRVCAMLTYIVVLINYTYLVIDGRNPALVDNLGTYLIVSATALLGIYSITETIKTKIK